MGQVRCQVALGHGKLLTVRSESSQGLTSITVRWNDNPSVTSTLKVTSSSCTPSGDNGSTVTNTYQVMSVFGVNFGNTQPASVSIPLCQPTTTTYEIWVDKMYVPNTGGIGQPPRKEVDRYLWTIPSGYQAVPSASNPVATSTNSITLMALTGESGSLTVQGSLRNTCGMSTSLSNSKTITINRTPAVSLTPQSGFTGLSCGYSLPFTYTVTATSCASGYSWSVPTGLSGSSTSNSISLTFVSPPANGTSYSLGVTQSLSNGTTVSRTVSIPYSSIVPKPTITTDFTNYTVCDGESLYITLNLPQGYSTSFGFDYYADGQGIFLDNGGVLELRPKNNPLHLNNLPSQGTVRVYNAGGYDVRKMGVRLMSNTPVCGSSDWSEISKKFGVYSNSEFTINGPSAVCPNTSASFTSSISGSLGVTGYQWTPPPGWSSSGASTPSFHVSVPFNFSGGQAVLLRLQNRCGWTNTPRVLMLSMGYGCGYYRFATSPNPATDKIVISGLDPNAETEVQLFDQTSTSRASLSKKSDTIEIDVSQLPNGLYYLKMTHNKVSETQQIIVKH